MFFLKAMKRVRLLYEAMQAGAKSNIKYLYIPDSAHVKCENTTMVSPYIVGLWESGVCRVVGLSVHASLLSEM